MVRGRKERSMRNAIRKKLTELLHEPFLQYKIDKLSDTGDIADYLIANGVTVQQWIPVTERKPEDGVKVLVSVRGRNEALIGWYDADLEDWVVEEGLEEKKLMPVTHWQEKPLPAREG